MRKCSLKRSGQIFSGHGLGQPESGRNPSFLTCVCHDYASKIETYQLEFDLYFSLDYV